jgi:hypothetical protein
MRLGWRERLAAGAGGAAVWWPDAGASGAAVWWPACTRARVARCGGVVGFAAQGVGISAKVASCVDGVS